MALIDTLLAIPTTQTEVVHVVRKVKYEKPNGAEGYTEKIIGDFTVSTQPLGSLNKIEGLTLESSLAGNQINSVFGIYSPDYGYKEGDIITRPDGYKYEVKAVEPLGEGTLFEHVKVLLVKVDNQDE